MSATAALLYVGVFIAAVLEGEAVFVAASVGVTMGRLNGWGVLVAGALGGAAGDQLVFYAVRGRFGRWIERSAAYRQKRDRVQPYVRRYVVPLVLASRFLPGLRMAIPAASAAASVSPWLFSTLNLVSAFAWAAVISAAVTWAGPASLARVGLTGPTALLLPGALVIIAFVLLRRIGSEPSPS